VCDWQQLNMDLIDGQEKGETERASWKSSLQLRMQTGRTKPLRMFEKTASSSSSSVQKYTHERVVAPIGSLGKREMERTLFKRERIPELMGTLQKFRPAL
jgi:hypothetical protein